jgi:hypothetical protein
MNQDLHCMNMEESWKYWSWCINIPCILIYTDIIWIMPVIGGHWKLSSWEFPVDWGISRGQQWNLRNDYFQFNSLLQACLLYYTKCCKLKGIGSILFLKNGLKKICRKNYKNHLRSNNYEVCTALAHCFPNILDAIVLKNINLFEDKIWRLSLWSNETDWISVISRLYTLSTVYISTSH